MVGFRTLTAAVGLAVSLAVSYLAWRYLNTLAVFLFLPFVPILFRGWGDAETDRPPVRRCPVCGFETRDPAHEYCPYDGSELETESPE
jgi:hypothetical protein